MIADLTGALGALYDPLRRQARERALGRTLHVNIGARRQPALLQPAADCFQHSGIERRVQKYDVDWLRWPQQEPLRVLDDDGSIATAEPFQRLREVTAD